MPPVFSSTLHCHKHFMLECGLQAQPWMQPPHMCFSQSCQSTFFPVFWQFGLSELRLTTHMQWVVLVSPDKQFQAFGFHHLPMLFPTKCAGVTHWFTPCWQERSCWVLWGNEVSLAHHTLGEELLLWKKVPEVLTPPHMGMMLQLEKTDIFGVFFNKIQTNYKKVLHINPNQKNGSFAQLFWHPLTSLSLRNNIWVILGFPQWMYIGYRLDLNPIKYRIYIFIRYSFPQLYNPFINLLSNGEEEH